MEEKISNENIYKSKVAYATGTGRCGTKFLSEAIKLLNNVASCHERNALNEAFHRYCKWNRLPVDSEGFLYTKEQEINKDLDENNFSFESSPHLAFSIEDLYNRFFPKIIILIRRPENVINSYLKKEIYANPVIIKNHNLAAGYQYPLKFHQSFGRIIPSGDAFKHWNSLTNVGKLAWWWKSINSEILNQLNAIPKEHYKIVKIEELDYIKFLEILDFLAISEKITEKKFYELVQSKPNSYKVNKEIKEWGNLEWKEFKSEVEELCEKFGYDIN